MFLASPDCITDVLLPLLSIEVDHFFSKVDHFLMSSPTWADVEEVFEFFEVESFECTSLVFSLVVEFDFDNRVDLSDVILLVLETVREALLWPFVLSDVCSFFLESISELLARSMSLIDSDKLL